MTRFFLPEGYRLLTPENRAVCASPERLRLAAERQTVLEGTALLCDAAHDLTVSLGGGRLGIIPRTEAALGIAEGTTRDIAILTRVGRPVSFVIDGIPEDPGGPLRLSRRKAQRMALDRLLTEARPGMVLPASVTHLEPFGAFVDIGCGVVSMVGIENISVSRISHPAQRFSVGQRIYVAVQDLDLARERILLTHKELLGTWLENVQSLQPGMTVPGIVRGIKDYGVFVELAPNLSGLAEPKEGLAEGDRVSVFLKAILPERMKIKLLVIDKLPPAPPGPLPYFITGSRLSWWRYAPEGCTKTALESVFLE